MSKHESNFKISYHKLFNRLMTIAAIALLLILFYKYGYRPASDLITNDLADNTNEITNTIQPEPEKEPDITISLSVVGDIMCHNTQYYDAYDSSTKTYDFSYVFDDVADKLRNADLTIGNIETTFAGADRGYSSYPTFNTPDALAVNLRALGFDVLSTSNNHSLDKGYSGLTRTIEILDQNEISHMGTYSSEEASKEILIKDVKGIKMAFLAYTYGTNGIPVPKGKEYCINLIDKDKIKSDIQKAKDLGAELIAVNMHWGEEYRLKPTKEQKSLADFLFENGVDLILGSHAHVLEPMEKRTITLEDGTTKDGFVIYSLGNFVSGQTKDYTFISIILKLEITKHSEEGKFTIDKIEYTPTYVDRKNTTSNKKFKIWDIKKSIAAYESGELKITKALYNDLVKSLERADKILAGNI